MRGSSLGRGFEFREATLRLLNPPHLSARGADIAVHFLPFHAQLLQATFVGVADGLSKLKNLRGPLLEVVLGRGRATKGLA